MSERELLREWEEKGRPLPPPHIFKQKTVKEYADTFSLPIFIETGTWNGDMVHAMLNHFRKIISVELSELHYKKAEQSFSHYPHVSIIHGDSGKVLPEILTSVSEACLFWLDGHYSGGDTAKGDLNTPILQELEHILNHSHNHVILIDDARLFNGQDDYPTLAELETFILQKRADIVIETVDDIIRIHQK